MSIQVLCPFFIWIVWLFFVGGFFLVLSFISSLKILCINPYPICQRICPPFQWIVFSFCWWLTLLCKIFLVWCSPICLFFFFYFPCLRRHNRKKNIAVRLFSFHYSIISKVPQVKRVKHVLEQWQAERTTGDFQGYRYKPWLG